jgi:pimeloyl-ACP methyl ester carboxylesterase
VLTLTASKQFNSKLTSGKNYVLVHGLGLGGWCWQRVANQLRLQGHNVYTPSLTGSAERSHLATAEVNLDTHITDVVSVMKWEDLHDVILVGHSYGGSVVTGAADRAADRIQRLVYLDAFILRDGESVLSLQPSERVQYYEDMVKQKGDGWLVFPNSAEFYGLRDPNDRKWVDELSVPQPFGTLQQPLSLVQKEKPKYKRSYIWASGFTHSPFVRFAERVREDDDWDYHELPAGHMAMISHPDEVTSILLGFAE